MPLPESERLAPRFRPFLGVAAKVLMVLTASVLAGALAIISLHDLTKRLTEGSPPYVVWLLVSLALCVVVIVALIWQLWEVKRRYETAVKPLYEHHPSTDDGIDVQRNLVPTSLFRNTGRETRIHVAPREGKVLLFACIGDSIASIESYLLPIGGDFNREHKSVRNLILNPHMFVVDVKGEAGELWVLTHAEAIRIVTIEWLDARKLMN